MLPDPLHPALVHIPIALALLVPLMAAAAVLAIRFDVLPRRVWSGVVLLSFVLVIGSWVAMETGEADEEIVERVVAESFIEAHEEAAELFMVMGVVVAAVAVAGLLAGSVGQFARLAALVLSFGLLASGVRVGHLGGSLVYEQGAASAHSARLSDRAFGTAGGTVGAPDARSAFAERAEHDRGHDDDDDDDD